MKIVAISGSLRAASSNTALVRAALASPPPGVETMLYDGLASLPHFSPELDGDAAPASVWNFRAQIASADGVLICTPEYAYGIPGSLKNALDWLVTSGELWRKPVAVLSASPSALGGEKAHAPVAHAVGPGSGDRHRRIAANSVRHDETERGKRSRGCGDANCADGQLRGVSSSRGGEARTGSEGGRGVEPSSLRKALFEWRSRVVMAALQFFRPTGPLT